jgi:hypothetical protein
MPWNLKIGDWSSIGEYTFIYNLGESTIGSKSTISHRANLCAGTHDFTDPALLLLKPPIVFHDQVWICTDTFVGPGVVVLEALSCELPVQSTDATPWRNLPAVGCGWSIPVGAGSLAEALAECMILEAHELKLMGKIGRKLVEDSFTWQSIAQQMKMVYRWCLAGENPPDCGRFV